MKSQHTMPTQESKREPTEFPLIEKGTMSGAPAVDFDRRVILWIQSGLHETS